MTTRLRELTAWLDGWPRRALALILLLLALATGVHAARSPRPAPGAAVVVAVHDLPAGAVISDHDVSATAWGGGPAPPHAYARPAEVVGRRVAGPVGTGEAVTATRLVGTDLTAGLVGDQVAVAVPISGTAAGSVATAGDTIELIAAPVADGADAAVIARSARVLAVLPGSSSGPGGDSEQLVLAVDRSAATGIAAALGRPIMTAVVRDS